MSPSLEVDDQIYDLLKREAEPFVDSPNSVLRRLLGLAERSSDGVSTRLTEPINGGRSRPPAGRRSSRTRTAKTKSERAPAGSILPEEEYVQPLLKSLVELDGEAPSREIIERVGKMLQHRLTDLDRANLGSGGIRWQNRLQFVRLRLIERGLMTRDAPRGVWAITEKGRESVSANP